MYGNIHITLTRSAFSSSVSYSENERVIKRRVLAAIFKKGECWQQYLKKVKQPLVATNHLKRVVKQYNYTTRESHDAVNSSGKADDVQDAEINEKSEEIAATSTKDPRRICVKVPK